MSDLAEYNAARNAMLQQESPEALIKFYQDRGLVPPDTLASAELILHKTITGVVSLPMELRSKSKKWLKGRGFKSLDDGDVP